ncbi:MAG: hypothetical protein D8M59_04485 [Planctomycetes bacterium]|nr:hypothetical protein [Planctomycetota bacterium]
MLCQWAVPAQAQPYGGRVRYRPTVTLEDLESMHALFDTDESQDMLIRSLYDGFQLAFNDGASRTKKDIAELLQQAREDPNRAEAYRRLGPLRADIEEQWASEAAELEESFFSDVKALLSEEQAESWPKYERDRRRRTLLHRSPGRYSGETVDLIRILTSLELEDEALEPVNGLVDQYAEELDRKLQEREDLAAKLRGSTATVGAAPGPGGGDNPSERLRQRDDLDRKRRDLRDLNHRYMDLMAGALSPEDGKRFRRLFLEQCYVSIYRTTQADMYIEQVAKVEDLSEEQSQQIADISQRYTARLNDIRRQMVELQNQRENAEAPSTSVRGTTTTTSPPPRNSGGLSEQQQERWRVLWEDQRTLVSDTVDELFEVLTPEQQEATPKYGRNPFSEDPSRREQLFRNGQPQGRGGN